MAPELREFWMWRNSAAGKRMPRELPFGDDDLDVVVDLSWSYEWAVPAGLHGALIAQLDDAKFDDNERIDNALREAGVTAPGSWPIVNFYPAGKMTAAVVNARVDDEGREGRAWYGITPPIYCFAKSPGVAEPGEEGKPRARMFWICPEVYEATGEVMTGDPRRDLKSIMATKIPEDAQVALDSFLEKMSVDPRFIRNPAMRANPSVKMYIGFHQHAPKKIGAFNPNLTIPSRVIKVGAAKNVLYRSDKLNPGDGSDEGWIDYIHEHSSGVHVYLTDARAEGEECAVPGWLQNVKELTWLGKCLGFEFDPGDGAKLGKARGTHPLPDLYCIPSGKALIVIQGKRKVLAMIWGGKLGVEPRGIVH